MPRESFHLTFRRSETSALLDAWKRINRQKRGGVSMLAAEGEVPVVLVDVNVCVRMYVCRCRRVCLALANNENLHGGHIWPVWAGLSVLSHSISRALSLVLRQFPIKFH